jgi:hypothetical protein
MIGHDIEMSLKCRYGLKILRLFKEPARKILNILFVSILFLDFIDSKLKERKHIGPRQYDSSGLITSLSHNIPKLTTVYTQSVERIDSSRDNIQGYVTYRAIREVK